MSIISVFTVAPAAKAALPGLGLLCFDGRGGARFQLGGQDHFVALPRVGLLDQALITIWCDATSRTVLLHRHKGMVAACVRLDGWALEYIPVDHDQSLEGGLWHDDFVETDLGPLLVYELGVIAFNRDGSVRWRAEHPDIQWVCLGIEGERVVFDNEFEGQWRYRIEDGQKLVVSKA